ncbi:MAG: hypothetical protein ABIR91_05460 [Candidatus Saccharimonadales bacterium]
MLKKINIRKLYYHLSHQYVTRENVIIAVAFVIAASWAWGSIGVMQRNYHLQQEVDTKSRQQKLVELEVLNAQFEKRYYQSDEYQELEVRRRLGLANPGEKVLILPPSSRQAQQYDQKPFTAAAMSSQSTSQFQQWMNFLFGGNRQNLQE